jgi:uncharacterized protein
MSTSMRVVIASAIIGLSLILAFWVAASSVKYRSKAAETIVVTGLAEKDFVSDLIVWNGTYSRKSMDLKSAYASLKQDENSIRQYLKGKGIAEAEMVFSSVVINKEFNNKTDENGRRLSQEFTGYNLSQTVKVESKDVNKVDRISREATELIETGIELNSSPPAYYYSKLADIKIDLLGKASADGKNRAESIAKNAGCSLGNLKKASMGVFQITGKNSNENYSYGGAFNTSEKNKTGSITIKMEFATN